MEPLLWPLQRDEGGDLRRELGCLLGRGGVSIEVAFPEHDRAHPGAAGVCSKDGEGSSEEALFAVEQRIGMWMSSTSNFRCDSSSRCASPSTCASP